MEFYRIAGSTLNAWPLDLDGNLSKIKSIISQAKNDGVSLLCLPELALTGYGCEDRFLSPSFIANAFKTLEELIPACEDIAVAVGLPITFQGSLYNCAAMIVDGRLVGINPKKVLARDGLHYEPRWFTPWVAGDIQCFKMAGDSIPIGDVVYQLGEVIVGIEICEEAWTAGTGAAHRAGGCDVVLNPSASHFSFGKDHLRRQLVGHSSNQLRVHYVYSNLVGLEAGRIIYDGGVIHGINGHIASTGNRFEFGNGGFSALDLNLNQVRVKKLSSTGLMAKPTRNSDSVIEVPWALPSQSKGEKLGDAQKEMDKNEEMLRACSLGLYGYLVKSRAKGYVVSLSGGRDSSAVSILVASALKFALEELGSKQVAIDLQQPDLDSEQDVKVWVDRILTLVYQASKHSSESTLNAAKGLATSLGTDLHEANIQGFVDSYEKIVEGCLGRKLNWQDDDLTRQNIQARVRAPLAWLFANVKGAILLATSNRSEASVGYTTMDGDTAGGLAPIAGVDKAFLTSWLEWVEKKCEIGLGPLVALSKVNSIQATAELRPEEQKDETDLMPYPILNRIEQLFLEEKLGADDITWFLVREYSGQYSKKQLSGFVEKFCKLWTQNQWKRERLPVSFHLDTYSTDSRSWCRYPVLSKI